MENPEKYMIPCPTQSLFGIPCPGCGVQRAILELFKGNFIESLKYYPPLIPVLLLIILLILHLKFEIKNGANILKYFFIFNIIIIVINYITKFI